MSAGEGDGDAGIKEDQGRVWESGSSWENKDEARGTGGSPLRQWFLLRCLCSLCLTLISRWGRMLRQPGSNGLVPFMSPHLGWDAAALPSAHSALA